MDDLDVLLEQYRVSDLNTLQLVLKEGRHRRADLPPDTPEPAPSTYARAGCRRAPGACAG
jgi:hypothetical protein